ncbi:MAG: pseudouridine synthase [Thermoanaerobaculia bacterium]
MSLERVQKLLARAGVASRRDAEELIRGGRVTVNGEVVDLGAKADPEADAIKVDGKRIHPAQPFRYILLNKPGGYITTRSDPEGRPTVYDLLPEAWRRTLSPVGRLDWSTEGLLLLTNDGTLAQRVAHPRYGCRKVYHAKVKGEPPESQLDRIRRGMVIDGKRTAPAEVSPLPSRKTRNNTWLAIELGEGRTRQIREMFFRIGHPVGRLKRVAIGPVTDRGLPLGAFRELSPKEVAQLSGRSRRGGGRRRRAPGDAGRGD